MIGRFCARGNRRARRGAASARMEGAAREKVTSKRLLAGIQLCYISVALARIRFVYKMPHRAFQRTASVIGIHGSCRRAWSAPWRARAAGEYFYFLQLRKVRRHGFLCAISGRRGARLRLASGMLLAGAAFAYADSAPSMAIDRFGQIINIEVCAAKCCVAKDDVAMPVACRRRFIVECFKG